MNNVCVLNENISLPVRTWRNKRVVTYEDIAKAHKITQNTVRLAFTRHKNELIKNEDYFDLTPYEARKYCKDICHNNKQPDGGYQRMKLFTESGYLVLACTFKGKASAVVRRTLVNNYFKVRDKKIDSNITQNNIFDMAINVINKMRDMQEQIDHNEKRVSNIEEKISDPEEGALSLTKVAEKYGWYTTTGHPHSRFAGHVAKACGIDVDYKTPFNKEFSQCVPIFSNGKSFTMMYIKTAGLSRIDKWCTDTDNGNKFRHVTYYKRDTDNHRVGDVQSAYYSIDGIHKFKLKE